MKNTHLWTPTKFDYLDGRLAASRNPNFVAPSSWLVTELTARFYQSAIPAHATGALLDLGCGSVPLFAAYREHVDSVTCVDWENTLHGTDFLDCHADLNQRLPLEGDRYDTVILSDVLEHIMYPEALLSEIARVLSDKGKLLMNVPFLYPLHETPHDYFRYTQFALNAIADRAGLDVIAILPLGGRVTVLADVLSKALRRRRLLRGVIRLIQECALMSDSRRQSVNKLENAVETSPLGYAMIARKR